MGWLQMVEQIVNLLNQGVAAYTRQVAVNEFNAKLQWAQTLQSGLQPLEQGDQSVVTDAQRLAAVKAVADAWARMPS